MLARPLNEKTKAGTITEMIDKYPRLVCVLHEFKTKLNETTQEMNIAKEQMDAAMIKQDYMTRHISDWISNYKPSNFYDKEFKA
jgi:inhibitor of KinA sporulation pathway (predicted exonuclease)